MDGETEQNEERDLGATIDDRMQLGRTAAKILVAQATSDALTKLLIEKGIITADEFIEKLSERRQRVNDNVNEAIAENLDDEAERKSINDAKRFLETLNEGIDSLCEKVRGIN